MEELTGLILGCSFDQIANSFSEIKCLFSPPDEVGELNELLDGIKIIAGPVEELEAVILKVEFEGDYKKLER